MTSMEDIISLCKRRGFIFQGSEIYGGLAGTWDYGPLGVLLRTNVTSLWWKRFVDSREDMYGINASILMNQNVWKSSGHVDGFSDPLVEDIVTKKRYRADHLLEDAGISTKGLTLTKLDELIKEKKIKSPDGNTLGDVRQFNMMFKTHVGATEDEYSISYLRPETAGGMFVNYKNVIDSMHPKIPFGLAQIGKAFRNEIAPRDFIFRLRELEQMEIEYFIHPDMWQTTFTSFLNEIYAFTKDIGLNPKHVHELEIAPEDRAHYSQRTIDIEFDFPFGRKELFGLAYRGDFDLSAHTAGSNVDLSYFDEETKTRYVPHVIEPSFGVERTLLAILSDAYCVEETKNSEGSIEQRVFLKFAPRIAPIKAAIFPLLKNKPALVSKAREVFMMLKKEIPDVMFDDNGNIGKRYRRQDEIGTPFCVTIDFDTIEKNAGVTIRHRDTGVQERVAIDGLVDFIKKSII